MITVRYRGRIPDLCGAREDNIEAATMRDVMRHIKTHYPKEVTAEAKKMLVTVNGESILLLKVYDTPLRDGDTVSFLPVCGGG